MLSWIDLRGTRQPIKVPHHEYLLLALSPTENKSLINIGDSIAILDLAEFC